MNESAATNLKPAIGAGGEDCSGLEDAVFSSNVGLSAAKSLETGDDTCRTELL